MRDLLQISALLDGQRDLYSFLVLAVRDAQRSKLF